MGDFLGKNGSIIITFAIWAAVFYFLLILPNKKKQKKYQEMINALKEGSEIVTTGGIKGVIVSVDTEFVTLRVDKGVNMQIAKGSISRIIK